MSPASGSRASTSSTVPRKSISIGLLDMPSNTRMDPSLRAVERLLHGTRDLAEIAGGDATLAFEGDVGSFWRLAHRPIPNFPKDITRMK